MAATPDICFDTVSLFGLYLVRMCVWESIAMKRVLQKSWSDHSTKPKKPLNAIVTPGTVDFNIEDLGKDDKDASTPSPAADAYNPVTINTKYLNFVLTQTPHCITPLYQGTVCTMRCLISCFCLLPV